MIKFNTHSIIQASICLFLLCAYVALYTGIWAYVVGRWWVLDDKELSIFDIPLLSLGNLEKSLKKSNVSQARLLHRFLIRPMHKFFTIISVTISYLLLHVHLRSFMRGRIKGMSLPFFAAALWVSLEYLRTYLLSGFPWALIGYSQWKFLSLIQAAEYTGVYGISFIIVFVNIVAAQSLAAAIQSADIPMGYSWIQKFIPVLLQRSRALTSTIVIMAALILWGSALFNNNECVSPPYVTVGVLQGNIDQYKKWDGAYQNEILRSYYSLANESAKQQPDLIVWPETALPGYLPYDARLYGWVGDVARQTNVYHLIGAPFYDGGTGYNNASFLFGPQGEILGWHKKTHLVPFGEFVPFRRFLEPYFGILNSLGDFSRGKEPSVLSVKSVLWGPAICSENFFGSLVRRFVKLGAQILVSQTNDAWFFKTSAPMQHFIMNVFRAVENRRPVVVCGNTGVSGIIEHSGRVSQIIPPFTAACLVSRVAPQKHITFYTQWGDVFAIMCSILSLFIIIKTLGRIKHAR